MTSREGTAWDTDDREFHVSIFAISTTCDCRSLSVCMFSVTSIYLRIGRRLLFAACAFLNAKQTRKVSCA